MGHRFRTIVAVIVRANVMVTTCTKTNRLLFNWFAHSVVVFGSNPLKESVLDTYDCGVLLGVLDQLLEVFDILSLLWWECVMLVDVVAMQENFHFVGSVVG